MVVLVEKSMAIPDTYGAEFPPGVPVGDPAGWILAFLLLGVSERWLASQCFALLHFAWMLGL